MIDVAVLVGTGEKLEVPILKARAQRLFFMSPDGADAKHPGRAGRLQLIFSADSSRALLVGLDVSIKVLVVIGKAAFTKENAGVGDRRKLLKSSVTGVP